VVLGSISPDYGDVPHVLSRTGRFSAQILKISKSGNYYKSNKTARIEDYSHVREHLAELEEWFRINVDDYYLDQLEIEEIQDILEFETNQSLERHRRDAKKGKERVFSVTLFLTLPSPQTSVIKYVVYKL
jgi:FtsZ-binding cell division protein ZapB